MRQEGFFLHSPYLIMNSGPQVLRNLQCRLCHGLRDFLELKAQTSIVSYGGGDVLSLSLSTKRIFSSEFEGETDMNSDGPSDDVPLLGGP